MQGIRYLLFGFLFVQLVWKLYLFLLPRRLFEQPVNSQLAIVRTLLLSSFNNSELFFSLWKLINWLISLNVWCNKFYWQAFWLLEPTACHVPPLNALSNFLQLNFHVFWEFSTWDELKNHKNYCSESTTSYLQMFLTLKY